MALLGAPHKDRYIAQLQSTHVQWEYVESVEKYLNLKEEREKREVQFVVLSTCR